MSTTGTLPAGVWKRRLVAAIVTPLTLAGAAALTAVAANAAAPVPEA